MFSSSASPEILTSRMVCVRVCLRIRGPTSQQDLPLILFKTIFLFRSHRLIPAHLVVKKPTGTSQHACVFRKHCGVYRRYHRSQVVFSSIGSAQVSTNPADQTFSSLFHTRCVMRHVPLLVRGRCVVTRHAAPNVLCRDPMPNDLHRHTKPIDVQRDRKPVALSGAKGDNQWLAETWATHDASSVKQTWGFLTRSSGYDSCTDSFPVVPGNHHLKAFRSTMATNRSNETHAVVTRPRAYAI